MSTVFKVFGMTPRGNRTQVYRLPSGRYNYSITHSAGFNSRQNNSKLSSLHVVVAVVGYPTPSEGWGHGGRPWSPRAVFIAQFIGSSDYMAPNDILLFLADTSLVMTHYKTFFWVSKNRCVKFYF